MRGHPPRVLIAKIGVDVHDRGVKVVARALRDAGMEVLYLGTGILPAEIATTAEQEDVDVIGISSMEGMHHVKVPQIMKKLKERGLAIPVICGGVIPLNEANRLKTRHGVLEVFSPGTSLASIIEAFKKAADV
jgi:methylmalonyl-CoA mutase C-terminal domain/subunit